ncbi:MAG: SUMF1/EgtB/PvdO family nonheme iron enzyme [Myxococcales bacterium]|nr:SUMF1/EgtB/PvdO family nonheme iron enzyme [Myxococcales bacterium]
MRRVALAVPLVLALAVACSGSDGMPGGSDSGSPSDATVEASALDAGMDAALDAPMDVSTDPFPSGPCPEGMTYVEAGGFCVDRWEAQVEVWNGTAFEPHSPYETLDSASGGYRAVTRPSVPPQGYISGEQALEACLTAGKRLCSVDEYRMACRGPSDTIYPYGADYQAGACNEGRPVHPLLELYGDDAGPEIWDSVHMNNPAINQLPDTLAPTGQYSACTNAYGAFDMVGNLHEWVDDPAGTFLGGFYVDAEINGSGCSYTTTAHQFGYHDYSTGFRCCLTPGD